MFGVVFVVCDTIAPEESLCCASKSCGGTLHVLDCLGVIAAGGCSRPPAERVEAWSSWTESPEYALY